MNDSPGRTPTGRDRARADSSKGHGSGNSDAGKGGGWGSGGAGRGQAGGGWGNTPWRPSVPPAPQPGVIPLRPLGVGEILDGAFTTARKYWRTALGVSLAVAVVTQAVRTVVTGLWFRDLVDLSELPDQETASLQELVDALKQALSGLAVASLVGLVGSIIAAAMLTVVVSRAVLGRPAPARETWAAARPRLLAMTGLFCLVTLLITGSFAVGLAPGLLLVGAGNETGGAALAALGALAGMVAAAWVWIRYSLAAPALILEKQGVIAAMRRSGKLVRGSWWRIFGIQLLATLLVFMVSAIVEIPANVIELIMSGGSPDAVPTDWPSLITSGISATISSALTLPITAGVTALLYMDQRIRRESLDIELARAAGYGTE
ncbi:glycerophosphoryl diester phosphodiesterase membrane domain-containing protein [Streptomyces sp. NPDC046261]|uniref:glycerophosphoryl diester phosphodiesterase membrane domain-containing protein n=1 Tax=Streptomyces sp. NPDC046261 TaxID=3157200 RepID=UPI003410A6DC